MKKDVYNLSKPQESIWLTEKYFENTSINRIITVCDFSNKLDNIDFEILKKAINNTIRYNDSFQIRLFLENGNVKQYFCDFEDMDFPIFEISSLDDFLEEDSKRENVFSLFDSPLYEFRLFKIKGTNTGGILANFHHIICDGFSTALCVRQIFESYISLLNTGALPNLNPDNLSYVDYLNSEKEYLESKKFIKDKEYWLDIYKTVPETATIYTNRPQKSALKSDAKRLTYLFDKTIMTRIQSFCKEIKISEYNFFMAVLSFYLSRVSRLDDLIIGTPILNRTNFKEKNTFGMFVSTVPFRITLDENVSFIDFAIKIAKDSLGMLRHQKYSYGYILEELRKKSSSLPNLYNVTFSYQITKASDNGQDYDTAWIFNNTVSKDLDIQIYNINDEDDVSISYDYNSEKYYEEDISVIHPRILHIINQILSQNEMLLKNIDIATPYEKKQILNDFNDTKTDYPRDETVISLFEKQVRDTPNATALNFKGETLTYDELNQRANSLANYLKEKVKPHDVVALFLDKSFEAIISMIATLKLGAAYLPIDISYPKDRIAYMLEDAGCKVLLTSRDLHFYDSIDIYKVYVDLSDISIYMKSTNFNSVKVNTTDLTYIIYTSGSTGKPKGVMVGGRGIVRLVKSTDYVKFEKGDRLLQTVSLSFDVSTFEIWGALLNGLEFFILKKNDLLEPKFFAKYLKDNKITTLFLSTSVFNKFCEEDVTMFSDLKYLSAGGEALSYKHTKACRDANPNIMLVNGYGPTENTTFSTYYNIENTDLGFIPIGFPLRNSTCYIVSKERKIATNRCSW